jgi:ankyrin repeat protein
MSAESVFSDANVVKLVLAAEQGDIDAINVLIERGVDVNARGRYNVTPLLRSLVARNKAGYSALLGHGADPNILNDRGFAAVNTAALEEDPYWLREALEHGGNADLVNEGNPFFPGQTPLYYAISKNRSENAKLLIGAKADVNHKDATQSCPVLRAAEQGNYEIVLALLNAGADFRQRDKAYDLVSWVSQRNENDFENEESRVWFRKTVQFLKDRGVKIELPK